MADDGKGGKRGMESAEQRRERLAEELRSNLHKRKALARAKSRPSSGDTPNEPAKREEE